MWLGQPSVSMENEPMGPGACFMGLSLANLKIIKNKRYRYIYILSAPSELAHREFARYARFPVQACMAVHICDIIRKPRISFQLDNQINTKSSMVARLVADIQSMNWMVSTNYSTWAWTSVSNRWLMSVFLSALTLLNSSFHWYHSKTGLD